MEIHQQRTKIQVMVACLLWMLTSTAVAAVSQRLFESEVIVQSQAPAERAEAMKSALEEVLVRVAGQATVLRTEPARVLKGMPMGVSPGYSRLTIITPLASGTMARIHSKHPQLVMGFSNSE